MGLIALIEWPSALMLAVATRIIASDAERAAPKLCARVIHLAANRLPLSEREQRLEEWLADLSEHETIVAKCRHATSCFLASGRMRRYAETVRVNAVLHVNGLGAIPLHVKLTQRRLWWSSMVFARGRPRLVKRVIALILGAWVLSKLLVAVRRVRRGYAPTFLKALSSGAHKDWRYEAFVNVGSAHLNLSSFMQAYISRPADRSRLATHLKHWAEAITARRNGADESKKTRV